MAAPANIVALIKTVFNLRCRSLMVPTHSILVVFLCAANAVYSLFASPLGDPVTETMQNSCQSGYPAIPPGATGAGFHSAATGVGFHSAARADGCSWLTSRTAPRAAEVVSAA